MSKHAGMVHNNTLHNYACINDYYACLRRWRGVSLIHSFVYEFTLLLLLHVVDCLQCGRDFNGECVIKV